MKSIEQEVSGAILRMIRARRQPVSPAEADLTRGSTGTITPAKLREARFSDFEAVAERKRRGGLNADSLENWERLWRLNPALAESGKKHPMGWVLEAEGAIVGYIGNILLRYRYGTATLTAATAHGLVVDPPYRAVGISLVAAYFRQKDVDLFVSTSAIEAVGKIALAFKSSPLPQPDYDTALFWVLMAHPFARALTQKLKLTSIQAKIGSVGATLVVGADKIARRRRPRRTSTPFTVNEIAVADIGEDFRTLWREKLQEGRYLLADRTPETLRWHFHIPGDRGWARVICCYRFEKLVGYAVIRTDTDEENGLRTSVVADMV